MDTVALLLRVRFFEVRIQKWICDLRSYGFFTTKKTGRSEKGSFTMTTACLCAPRERTYIRTKNMTSTGVKTEYECK